MNINIILKINLFIFVKQFSPPKSPKILLSWVNYLQWYTQDFSVGEEEGCA